MTAKKHGFGFLSSPFPATCRHYQALSPNMSFNPFSELHSAKYQMLMTVGSRNELTASFAIGQYLH